MLMLLAIVAVLLTLSMRVCTSATWHVNDSRAHGDTINVAIEISPLGISTRGDSLSGYYYDMVQYISRSHQRPVKIDGFTHLESAIEGLEKGRYDIVIGDIPANGVIREKFLATDPVLIDRQVLVQRRDSATGELRYPTQFSLLGDSIHIPLNSPFKTRLHNLTRELGDTIYIVEDSDLGAEQLIMLVALGELPNAVVNRHMATIMQQDYPQLDLSVEISFNQFQSWLLNYKDSILCDTINAWIGDFSASAEARELQKRYFGK